MGQGSAEYRVRHRQVVSHRRPGRQPLSSTFRASEIVEAGTPPRIAALRLAPSKALVRPNGDYGLGRALRDGLAPNCLLGLFFPVSFGGTPR